MATIAINSKMAGIELNESVKNIDTRKMSLWKICVDTLGFACQWNFVMKPITLQRFHRIKQVSLGPLRAL